MEPTTTTPNIAIIPTKTGAMLVREAIPNAGPLRLKVSSLTTKIMVPLPMGPLILSPFRSPSPVRLVGRRPLETPNGTGRLPAAIVLGLVAQHIAITTVGETLAVVVRPPLLVVLANGATA